MHVAGTLSASAAQCFPPPVLTLRLVCPNACLSCILARSSLGGNVGPTLEVTSRVRPRHWAKAAVRSWWCVLNVSTYILSTNYQSSPHCYVCLAGLFRGSVGSCRIGVQPQHTLYGARNRVYVFASSHLQSDTPINHTLSIFANLHCYSITSCRLRFDSQVPSATTQVLHARMFDGISFRVKRLSSH